jgi:hypothetical protein
MNPKRGVWSKPEQTRADWRSACTTKARTGEQRSATDRKNRNASRKETKVTNGVVVVTPRSHGAAQ